MSGYFPVWWEYVCTSVPDSEVDYYYLCRDPSSERAMKFMEKARSEAH
jgi:hypothetical protein